MPFKNPEDSRRWKRAKYHATKVARAPHEKTRKAVWYKNHRDVSIERTRRSRFKRLYDLTLEQYEQLLKRQGGQCAICGDTNGNRRLCVDHNHVTGQVRGLLCTSCNTALERLETAPLWYERALHYLEDTHA